LPLHSGSQVSSLGKIDWRDQSAVEFSAKRAPNPTPLPSQPGWRTAARLVDAVTSRRPLFISAYGDEASDQREIAFAHFHQQFRFPISDLNNVTSAATSPPGEVSGSRSGGVGGQ
jgi:hypothetical protein